MIFSLEVKLTSSYATLLIFELFMNKFITQQDLFNMLPAYPDVKYSASTEIKITNNEDVTLLN
jgi:hypothetical protein